MPHYASGRHNGFPVQIYNSGTTDAMLRHVFFPIFVSWISHSRSKAVIMPRSPPPVADTSATVTLR
ncbi:MAG: hypothetical protein JNL32_11440 [Candidatus Kapabacteria bacterium]|nr:hypothetical protein [Candidatus Kapabacteria bacterium]